MTTSHLGVGDRFPTYTVTVVNSGDLSNADVQDPYSHFATARSSDHQRRWRVIFFWTRDADPLSRAEITAFGTRHDEFNRRQVFVLGVSVDTKYRHFHWRFHHHHLKKLPFPIASDFNHALTADAGLLNDYGVAERTTFIVDPGNVIRHVSAVSSSAVTHVDEILGALDELMAGTVGDGPADSSPRDNAWAAGCPSVQRPSRCCARWRRTARGEVPSSASSAPKAGRSFQPVLVTGQFHQCRSDGDDLRRIQGRRHGQEQLGDDMLELRRR